MHTDRFDYKPARDNALRMARAKRAEAKSLLALEYDEDACRLWIGSTPPERAAECLRVAGLLEEAARQMPVAA